MKRVTLLVLLLTLSSSLFGQEQTIRLQFTNTKLSDALVHLRDEYGMHMSFDHNALSKFLITIDTHADSEEKALQVLTANVPIAIEKEGDVFILRIKEPEPEVFSISMRIIDASSGEALPFSNALVNNVLLTADYIGEVSLKSTNTSEFKARVSYMGYYIVDTTLSAGNHLIRMQPATINLKEIIIEGVPIDNYSITGTEPGNLRLNQKTATYLPGNGDNSIFNLLRLQPGILASGEQTGDMIIWGSYQGQSKIEYDGFTLFGLKNFLENISTVNPFSVQDLQVYKAGYGAEQEGRVGGIVKITGVEGRKDRAELKLNVNNETINAFASSPIGENTALTLAYRQSYTGLSGEDPVTVDRRGGNQRGRDQRTDFVLQPNYKYRDVNLKWSGQLGNDHFYVSGFLGNDNFDYSLDSEFGQNDFEISSNEINEQAGGSLFYGKKWKNNSSTQFQISSSGLSTSRQSFQEVRRGGNNPGTFLQDREDNNGVEELKVQLVHEGEGKEGNHWKAGIQLVNNESMREELVSDIVEVNDQQSANRMGYFFESKVNLEGASIRLGGRIDQPLNSSRVYLQPRLSLTLGGSDRLKISGSWGIYSQFLSKNLLIDALGNLNYIWNISNGTDIPVASSNHAVLGISGHQNGFTWRVEGFNKSTSGLSRYLRTNQINGLFSGESKSTGLDVFLSKEINRHYFWVSYTLSQTTELFDYFLVPQYRRALHDQTHEIKAVALIDLNPFFLSANYVYGSGFPDPTPFQMDQGESTIYSRLDVSARMKIRSEKPYMEGGLSLLNVLNRENVKYNNYIRLPENTLGTINFHTEALPFTPTLYFKLIF